MRRGNRRETMQKAYKNLVDYALAQGLVVSVYDGEEWQLKKSKDAKAICEAIESVDEASIIIRDADPFITAYTARAYISAYGLGDDETVIDHTANEWMEEWWQQYEQQIEQ
jgi:hypothetical protein